MTGRLILVLAGGRRQDHARQQLEADGAVRMCPDEWLMALGFDIYDAEACQRV